MLPNMQQQQRMVMTRRSESDMLSMAPIKLRLGHNDLTVPCPNNVTAAAWREKLYAKLGPLVANFDYSGIDLNANQSVVSQTLSKRLSQDLIAYPQVVKELVHDFAPEILTDEIFKDASDEQISLAFAQLAEVGYPFFFHLWATKRALAAPPEQVPTMPSLSRVV